MLLAELYLNNEQLLNTPSKHVFTDQKKEEAPSTLPPFVLTSKYEEVFARSVQTVFRSELKFRTSELRTQLSELQPWY